MILDELYKIIQDRKKKLPAKSYVASLFKMGRDRIVQKVGEEATEVVIAGKGRSRQRLIEEVADLWFHCLVLLSLNNVSPKEILQELEKRRKKAETSKNKNA